MGGDCDDPAAVFQPCSPQPLEAAQADEKPDGITVLNAGLSKYFQIHERLRLRGEISQATF